jgi:hypothetical protein
MGVSAGGGKVASGNPAWDREVRKQIREIELERGPMSKAERATYKRNYYELMRS